MKPSKLKQQAKQVLEADSSNLVPIRGGESVEVLTESETYANAVHIRIKELLRRYEETYFEIARALFEVAARKLYLSMTPSYPSFEKYTEEAVGIEFRKARYLVSIWWWFGIEQRAHPSLLQQAQEIGWTKSKELVSVVDRSNADRWFDLARTLNLGDLAKAANAALKKAGKKRGRSAPPEVFQGEFDLEDWTPGVPAPEVSQVVDEQGNAVPGEEQESEETPEAMVVAEPKPPRGMAVADPKSPGGEDVAGAQPRAQLGLDGVSPPDDVAAAIQEEKANSVKWDRMHFYVHEDFKEVITEALDNAKKTGETQHEGYALSLICLHYLSFYSKMRSMEIGEWLRRIERVTGLTIVAMDERTDEILYGVETLKRLAECTEGQGADHADQQRVGDQGNDVGAGGTSLLDQGVG